VGQIRTNAAAALLGVAPNTLRSWEQRFGHPTPRRTEGGHRIFELSEIEALRHALFETGDVAAAIAIVAERGEGPATPGRLSIAFSDFDEQKADHVLEQSLSMRSLERTIEHVLLDAVQRLDERSAERCFASRYATGWLAAAKRVAPPASRPEGVMIFEAGERGAGSASEGADLDALHAQALELMLRRIGLRTLSLTSTLPQERVGNALRALRPSALVLAGSGCEMTSLGKLVHVARQVCGELTIYDFRGAVPDSGGSTVPRLGQSPIEAVAELRQQLLEGSSQRKERLPVLTALPA
jgi:DNA-binding transcriptional MerR regulator